MIRPAEWQPVDGLTLEPNALRAATMRDRNVVVAAGPGAGKSELLAQRADYLFRTGASPYPRRILAISFKVDAARNLRDRVRRRSGGRFAARFDSFTFHAFAKRLIDNYRAALVSQQLQPDYRIDTHTRVPGEQITFADLVPLALEILSNNAHARGALRQTYSHVFLDEFQDATDEQYKFVKTAFLGTGAILTAVGDAKQRIMAWAGALDGIMQTFADEFSATPSPLYLNFRSEPRLRRMQNRMIQDMDPAAASPDEDLLGGEGIVEAHQFDNPDEEARAIAGLAATWLDDGVPPSEIAILVRQQSKPVTQTLVAELTARGIASRNEQENQDLAAEPIAQLIFNFMWVLVGERRHQAYTELMRVASRPSAADEAALRFDSQLSRRIREARAIVSDPSFTRGDLAAWRTLIDTFLGTVSRPVLAALSPAYQQGDRLDVLIEQTYAAIETELTIDDDPIGALKRLSDDDAVRILTIHKCKGLEFEKVVVLGVEHEFFWGDPDSAISEFFVAISRAKNHLVLTHASTRPRPSGHSGRWDERRTAHSEFLAYAEDD